MTFKKDVIKRFISYYKPYKLLFILDLIAALGMSGIQLVYPLVTTKIIDELIPNLAINSILLYVGLLLVLYIIADIFHFSYDPFLDCIEGVQKNAAGDKGMKQKKRA